MGSIKLNINYSLIVKNIILILSTILVAYLLNTALYIYLPKASPEYPIKSLDNLEYKRYDVKNAFKVKAIKKEEVKEVVVKKKEYPFLSNIILSAVYAMDSNGGFIIISEKGRNDTYLLGIDDEFKGYKLSKIFAKYVIFTKNGKEYKLSMLINNKKVEYEIVSETNDTESDLEDGIEVDDDKVSIKKDLINDYIENFDKIWTDISIKEVVTANGIDGFKIRGIRKDTVFEKLGLKKGDIIKSINNIELKSYNDAFKIYKQINKIKNFNFKILRNGAEEEINYEIK